MRKSSVKSAARPRIILGSSSPRRQELLERLGLKFTIIVPNTHEKHSPGETPRVYTARNARDKAQAAALTLPDHARRPGRFLVIGCDTIVVCKGKILEKPRDKADARRMLTMLSGRSHEVFSGLTILDVHASKEGIVPLKSQTRVVRTKVTFKKLAPAEITSYIATGEPMDKSGSYGAQGIGAYIIKKIEGSYTNVVGLPLTELCEMLGLDNLYRE